MTAILSETRNCARCRSEFEAQAFSALGIRIVGEYCPACDEARQDEWQRQKSAVEAMNPDAPKQGDRFARIATESGFAKYLNFDPKRAPAQFREMAAIKGGLLFQSVIPARGKTTTAVEIMRRRHNEGAKVCLFSAIRFGFEVATDDSERRERAINRAINADWLLIDDIGKGKVTPRVAESLFAVAEEREGKPTIWTTNATENAFHASLGDIAAPFLARLKRSTTLFAF